MKRLFAIGSLFGVLMVGVCVISAAQTRTDFSGTWVLDLEKVRDLPPDLKSYTLTVRQDEQRLRFQTHVDGDPNPGPGQDRSGSSQTDVATRVAAGGGGGASGADSGTIPAGATHGVAVARGRALALVIRRISYPLDGREISSEVSGQAPGTIKRQARWEDHGKKLQLFIARTFNQERGNFTSTIKELWELSDDGKVLKIKRTVNLREGWDEITLIFNQG